MSHTTSIEQGSSDAGRDVLALRHLLGPLVGGLVAAGVAIPRGTPVESGLLVFVVFALAARAAGRSPRWASLLTFVGALRRAAYPLLATALLLAAEAANGLPGLGAGGLAAVFVAAAGTTLVLDLALERRGPARRTRVAVIGGSRSADALMAELQIVGVTDYALVGRVATTDGDSDDGAMPCLGPLAELGSIVEGNRIDLLLMASDVPRLAVFNRIAESCLHLPVRLWQLSAFYEEVFGHVPAAEINASWFQYIVHPNFKTSAPATKRALDLVVGGALSLVALPLLAVLALAVRRDGGPAIFRQRRIGEGGRPFTLYKLRTMRVGSVAAAEWSAVDDPRVTRLGRILRRTHLDELPQLVNVLRGEMSLVGPRPEQPEFVDRLERVLPYYQRRHLVKPGVTGWAQVRCGYAGSETGSAWKLCHDLYYLKRRSVLLDIAILVETLRTLLFDQQYTARPASLSFVMAEAAPALEPAEPVAAQPLA